MSSARLGVDVGGTFTDCVLATSEKLAWTKLPTSKESPHHAVVEAFESLIKRTTVNASEVDTVVHGTTLALNTLLERRGALCGMLVTRGFRDVLELGRLRLPRVFDYLERRPEPLIRRQHVIEINERVYASGEMDTPLDLEEVERAVAELVEAGLEALAICFLHGSRHPKHEDAAAHRIRERYPGLFICASSEVWPQRGEYERFVTTVVNANVGPRMQQYVRHLEHDLAKAGFKGQLLLTKSNGGVMTAASTADVPVATLLSGPAAGVVGAWQTAQQAGIHRAIAFDMGGTSADISVLDCGIAYAFNSEVANLPLVMPSVDVYSIGAGGGSIARLDPAGIMKVGPESAGSFPGPACYGLGASEPTVTDAYVAAGILSPDNFLGGKMTLDQEAAHHLLSKKLDGDYIEVACQVIDVATATMYARFSPYLARLGVDPKEFVLIAYGGAGPTHAFLLARELGIPRILVPPRPGLLCAVGCLVADLRFDFIASLSLQLSQESSPLLEIETRRLASEAEEVLAQQTKDSTRLHLWSADMRYGGQTSTVNVALSAESLGDPSMIGEAFHIRYKQLYGQNQRGNSVELINFRLQAVVPRPKKEEVVLNLMGLGEKDGYAPRSRTVYLGGEKWKATVLNRWSLRPGNQVVGPAVIEQEDSTVFVPPRWQVKVDEHGNLLAEEN